MTSYMSERWEDYIFGQLGGHSDAEEYDKGNVWLAEKWNAC